MKYNQDIINFWKQDEFKNITVGQKQFPEGWDVRPFLKELVGDEDIIEVGCGYGRLVEGFSPAQYLGVDINPACVQEAKIRNPKHKFNDFNVTDELPTSTWLMFYTVLLHVDDNDILPYLQNVTKNAQKVLISEILGQSWRSWKYAFNREEHEYDSLMASCGFTKTRSLEKQYQHYNTPYKFLVYERTNTNKTHKPEELPQLHKLSNKANKTFDKFDKIYCVHLDRDYDRKQQVTNEFNRLGILNRITWLSATPPTSTFTSNNFQVGGELGCTLSHLKVIVDALNSNIEFGIVVFEDDATFTDISHVSEALNELPNNWDVLYFGGNPYEPMSDFSPTLVTTGKFLTTVGYAISKKALANLALYTIDCMGQPYPEAVADVILNSFSQKNTSFCIYPPIVTQQPGASTLRKMHRDYTSLIQQNWKKFKPTTRV